MKHMDGHYECDYCHGVEGSFYSDTGNHVHCQQIGEQTTKADTHAADLAAPNARVEELEKQLKDAQKVAVYFYELPTGFLASTNAVRLVELYKAALKGAE